MTGQVKTFLLLALLSGIIIVLGRAMGGNTGLIIALGFALLMNLGSYWYSDSLVLKIYRAREISPTEAPLLHRIVEDLARAAGIPKPKVCITPEEAPNAFATGRNPEHAAVAVTNGLLRLLNANELRGVLAHEIGHIAHRDTLIQCVAGVLASVIVFLANLVQWGAIFGLGRRDENGSGPGMLGGLLLAMLAPLAASLIQMAISRSREFMADAAGARYSGSPASLASALGKLESISRQVPMHSGGPTTAHLFIVNPFSGGISSLFSTHPPTAERIARLMAMQGSRPE